MTPGKALLSQLLAVGGWGRRLAPAADQHPAICGSGQRTAQGLTHQVGLDMQVGPGGGVPGLGPEGATGGGWQEEEGGTTSGVRGELRGR